MSDQPPDNQMTEPLTTGRNPSPSAAVTGMNGIRPEPAVQLLRPRSGERIASFR